MPELPEVETVRRGLVPILVGNAFARVEQRRPDLRFPLRDGSQVLIRGRLSLYEARGDFQMVAEHLEPAGEGALQIGRAHV